MGPLTLPLSPAGGEGKGSRMMVKKINAFVLIPNESKKQIAECPNNES